MLDIVQIVPIDEEMIGEDYETTVQGYLLRNERFNLDPKQVIANALRKLGYDGNNLHFLGGNFQAVALNLDVNQIQDIIQGANVEQFYRLLTLDALNYLGY